MKYSYKILLAVGVILLVFVFFAAKSTRAPDAPTGSTAMISPTVAPSSGEFGQSDVEALHEAIQDEYKAEAMYEAVVAKFGSVKPFSNIIKAEDRHSTAIARVLEAHGQPVPTPAPYKPEVPATISEACALGVTAEKANVALYDSLMQLAQSEDTRRVFSSNSDASQYRHLPAFEQCAN